MQICQRKGSFQCQQMMSNIDHWNQKRYLFKREPLLRYENVSSALNFTGLSCASDRQFKFLAVDPVDVPYFIKLGLNGLKNSEESEYSVDPMAFIIDSQVNSFFKFSQYCKCVEPNANNICKCVEPNVSNIFF